MPCAVIRSPDIMASLSSLWNKRRARTPVSARPRVRGFSVLVTEANTKRGLLFLFRAREGFPSPSYQIVAPCSPHAVFVAQPALLLVLTLSIAQAARFGLHYCSYAPCLYNLQPWAFQRASCVCQRFQALSTTRIAENHHRLFGVLFGTLRRTLMVAIRP